MKENLSVIRAKVSPFAQQLWRWRFLYPYCANYEADISFSHRLYDVRQKRLCDEWKVSPNTGSGMV